MNGKIIGGLEIIGIRDPGSLDKERLLLRALETVKLSSYAIINVKSSGDKMTILNDKIFWFGGTQIVNTGEFIRLYSKKGTYEKFESTYGDKPAVYHDFYWGQTEPVWDGKKSDGATIFKIDTWTTDFIQK